VSLFGVRSCGQTGSGCGFDREPGVLILELLRVESTPPAVLSITHISRARFAPVEASVILSVTPIHGGVTDERGQENRHCRLA